MFARHFCRSEGIKVVSETVLGNNGRVIMLDSEFKTITKSIANRSMDARLAQADKSLSKVVNTQDKFDEKSVTLF